MDTQLKKWRIKNYKMQNTLSLLLMFNEATEILAGVKVQDPSSFG